MKFFITFLLFISLLDAAEDSWKLERFSFNLENDADFKTDIGYTHGGRISLLFFREDSSESWLNIPLSRPQDSSNFISFSYVNQMFTPYDLGAANLITDDRLYAGYAYFEVGLHQSTKSLLYSLSLQVGVIGPSSGMENLQIFFHDILDARHSAGWEYQLKEEFAFNLNYTHKWYLEANDFYGVESVLVPYASSELGNISIKASGGALYRVGFNIPKDYGMSSLDEAGYSSIPIESKSISAPLKLWHAHFNLSAGTNLILRDIFLDGNSFEDSHSIEKKSYNAYLGAGLSLRYKKFSIDYQHYYYTKEYEARGKHKEYLGYGSLIFNYEFY